MSVKVAEVRVVGSIASLNVALTVLLSGTPVAPFTGLVRVIVGAVELAVVPVVKVHTKLLANALPAKSFAPVVMVAVNKVLGARLLAGVNVAVAPTKTMVPVTAVVPGPVKVKVVPLIVAGSIAVLNVAEIFWLVGTFVAPLTGIVEMIVGALVFAVVPVVKVHTKFAASVLPPALIAPVVTVAVNLVLGTRFTVGMKIAVLLPGAYVTMPVTAVAPGPVRVNVVPLIVAGFMGSLKVAEIFWFSGTPVARFAGFVEVTVGMVPVVNVQTKLIASALPAGSFAPVVIVAVYFVLGSRLAAGVNVAVAPEVVTVPGRRLPLGPATVKVTVLSVVGFITLLKVAEMIWATGTPVARFAGFVEITVGATNPVCSRPQPPIRTASRNAGIQILRTFNLRISFSSSPCCKAFHTVHTRPDIYATSNFTGCSIKGTIRQRYHAYSNSCILPSVQY